MRDLKCYSFGVLDEHKQYLKRAAIKYMTKIYEVQLVTKPQILLVLLWFVVYIHNVSKCQISVRD